METCFVISHYYIFTSLIINNKKLIYKISLHDSHKNKMERIIENMNELIVEVVSKITLCVLLTQFGKTFEAIKKMETEIKQDDELGRSIHIVFAMNTLCNNTQFAQRLKPIHKKFGDGSVRIFSSDNKYNGPYKHVKNLLELKGVCADKDSCPRVIVMCSNTQRYEDGVEFLNFINENNINNITRAFVYYDELHEYITTTLRDQIEDINNLNIVKGITAFTATSDKIFETTGFWNNIKLLYLDNYNELNYAGCKDMIFNCVDDFFESPYRRPGPFNYNELDRQNLGFIKHVLERYPEILSENKRTFIPGHKRRASHNEIRDLVFDINSNVVVVVINGFEKTLQYKDCFGNRKTLLLTSNKEELCETIPRLINHHNLQHCPLVLTGLLCVGMGQTLTHETIGSFTSAIFGHMDLTNDELYQLFGRITGRIKHWEKYVQTQVYCSSIVMNRCEVMEECARNMVTNHNGDFVTQEDYREPMYKMGDAGQSAIENIRKPKNKKQIKKHNDVEPMIRTFNTQDEVKTYYNENLKDKLKGRGPNKRSPNEPDGFYLSTIGKGDNRTKVRTYQEIYNVRKWCLTEKTGRNFYTLHPYYEDIHDKTTVKWCLIYLIKD